MLAGMDQMILLILGTGRRSASGRYQSACIPLLRQSDKGFSFAMADHLSSLVSITVSGSSIAITSIEQELGTSRILAIFGGITLFTLTFGIAPLVLAPLSEVYGRKWVVIVSSGFFCIWHIPQALANNITCLAVVRFLAGIGGSTYVRHQ